MIIRIQNPGTVGGTIRFLDSKPNKTSINIIYPSTVNFMPDELIGKKVMGMLILSSDEGQLENRIQFNNGYKFRAREHDFLVIILNYYTKYLTKMRF